MHNVSGTKRQKQIKIAFNIVAADEISWNYEFLMWKRLFINCDYTA